MIRGGLLSPPRSHHTRASVTQILFQKGSGLRHRLFEGFDRRPESSGMLTKTPDEQEIIKEAKRWVLENKDAKIEGTYSSPRISSEIADCSMPFTFDHFNYCSLGCLYCFAYFFKSNNPAYKNGVPLKAVNVDSMLIAIAGHPKNARDRKNWETFYSRKFLLHWGGLADPFCTFEHRNQTGLHLLQGLGELNYPTLMSFKGGSILNKEYLKLFQKFAGQGNFAFQASIITGDDKLAQRIEIGVPSPTRRLKAVKILSDLGYWTILRLRPFVPGVSDRGLDDLLHRALESGINGVSMEFFALDVRANVHMKARYAWLGKLVGVPNLVKYYKATSPKERGGYMRTNRLIKEPYVRKVYEFCAKNGLVCGISDPDFKELNTSGSCCGMPDNFPRNRGLENWTRSQLTYHLKEARRLYHRTGELKELRFSEVYDPSNYPYLVDPYYSEDHICTLGRPYAERASLTQRDILQEQWNNLHSPSNPRNYFHGKLMPIGLCEEGNLLYRYNPMPYEKDWSESGIDLTR